MNLDKASKKVKEHAAKFQTEEDLDANENDLTPPETLQPDTDLALECQNPGIKTRRPEWL